MATQAEKEQVIRTIYYDEDGFDNVKIIYEKLKKVLPSKTFSSKTDHPTENLLSRF